MGGLRYFLAINGLEGRELASSSWKCHVKGVGLEHLLKAMSAFFSRVECKQM